MAEKKSCLRCGRCCMTANIILGEITKENVNYWKDKSRWFNLHRCDVNTKTKEGKTYFELKIPFICANLDMDYKKHQWFCRDYKNRPKICQGFWCAKAKEGN